MMEHLRRPRTAKFTSVNDQTNDSVYQEMNIKFPPPHQSPLQQWTVILHFTMPQTCHNFFLSGLGHAQANDSLYQEINVMPILPQFTVHVLITQISVHLAKV